MLVRISIAFLKSLAWQRTRNSDPMLTVWAVSVEGLTTTKAWILQCLILVWSVRTNFESSMVVVQLQAAVASRHQFQITDRRWDHRDSNIVTCTSVSESQVARVFPFRLATWSSYSFSRCVDLPSSFIQRLGTTYIMPPLDNAPGIVRTWQRRLSIVRVRADFLLYQFSFCSPTCSHHPPVTDTPVTDTVVKMLYWIHFSSIFLSFWLKKIHISIPSAEW